MDKKSYLYLLSMLFLPPTVGYSQDTGPIPKQLAGPPSEFEAMRPNNPIGNAVHSKSALLPIQLSVHINGLWSWQTDLPIDGDQLQMLVFSDNSTDWNISLRAPSGFRSQTLDSLTSDSRKTDFGISGESYPADYYQLDQVAKGSWEFTVQASNPKQKQGFLLVSSDSPQRIMSYQTSKQHLTGNRVGFAAYAYSDDNSRSSINTAAINITGPDGDSLTNQPMYDDGLHNDGHANDGVYGADFAAVNAGNYNVQIVMTGVAADGAAFIRTTEHLVPVIASDLRISSSIAYSNEFNENRLLINLPVDSYNNSAKYHVYAEVWGRSVNNPKLQTAISWIGGMVNDDNGYLQLGLDTRWIARAEATGPFELRNVRIEDPDHFIPIAEAKSIPLSVPVLPETATRAFSGALDQEMLMGQQPLVTNRGVGSKLLLVHGYCSGNVWGSVANQFTDEAIFMDLNQNRSHDQFAIRIHNFGSTYNSYGIVAHSQGGAAATHLYTYYWSGLDNATGSRLIQSVGTPYQGTALAGNLAALGSVFGVGCGSNTDLTYNGAASWLAGIPSWARSAVNYYSTSFTDVWWRYDYCHLATDLLLSDPEDGTTEKAYAQLSGAINRGHKTGWCHTSGMRDPAQTTDSSRNSTMNATAAR